MPDLDIIPQGLPEKADKEPVIYNRALPELKSFSVPEVKGWEYKDYRKWTDIVKPFDDEITTKLEERKKTIEEGVALGAYTPEHADNLLNEEYDSIYKEYEPKISQATKPMFENRRVAKVDKVHDIITKETKPAVILGEVYNQANLGQVETGLMNIEDEINKKQQEISGYTDNQPEEKQRVEYEIKLLESQKARLEKLSPTVRPVQVDRTKEGNSTVVDKYGVEGRVVENMFIPEGIIYDQDKLKEGDIIDAPDASKIWFKTVKEGRDYYLGVDNTEITFNDGTKGKPQAFRVYNDNGEIKLDPVKKEDIKKAVLPVQKAPEASMDELANSMNLLTNATGSTIFEGILRKTDKGFESSIYGEQDNDAKQLAQFFYSKPELAKEFGKWAKENAWGTAFSKAGTDSDFGANEVNRLLDQFFKEKKQEKESLIQQTGITNSEAQTVYSAQSALEKNQYAFLKYKERALSQIKSIEDQLKKNPSQELKDKREHLIAAYKQSHENYNKVYEINSPLLDKASTPEFNNYNRLRKEHDDLEEQRILNNRYFRDYVPSVKEQADETIVSQQGKIGYVGPNDIPKVVGEAVVGKLLKMVTGTAAFFSDGETLDRTDYYDTKAANYINSQKYKEVDDKGNTLWSGYLTNRLQDAASAGVDMATMVLAPEVSWFGKSAYLNRLPGLFAVMSASNYNDAYNDAKEAGITSPEGRHGYALGNMFINAAAEGIFDVKALIKGGLNIEAIDLLKKKYKGELTGFLPLLAEEATRKEGIIGILKTAKDFAKIHLSPKGIANSFIQSAEEFLFEESITNAGVQLFNVGINRMTRSNLDENVFTGKSIKDLFFTGLIMAPFMGAGQSMNTALSLRDGKNIMYQVAEEVGYDKVYEQLKYIKEQYNKGEAPKGTDITIVNDMLERMPYLSLLKKPDGVSESKWFLLRDHIAERGVLSDKMRGSNDALKPYFRDQIKEVDQSIESIMLLPDEILQDKKTEIEQVVKENLSNTINTKYEKEERQEKLLTTEQSEPVPAPTVPVLSSLQQELESLPTPEVIQQQKQQEIKSSLPAVNMTFIGEKSLLNRSVGVTFEHAETGEQIVKKVQVGKIQAGIQARFEILKKLIDCIN